MKISVITPTGGRHLSFKLCELWMSRQKRKPDEWIVVDDYLEPTKTFMNQKIIRPQPFWKNGDITLARNIIKGLEVATGDIIFIMEDDDWYHPDYIEFFESKYSEDKDLMLLGEGITPYYNVFNNKWMVNTNVKHAGLFQTSFRKDIILEVLYITLKKQEKKEIYIDSAIWNIECKKNLYFLDKPLSVGIKGLPGRVGLGYFHTKDYPNTTQQDTFLRKKLCQWIGNKDKEKYDFLMKFNEIKNNLNQ